MSQEPTAGTRTLGGDLGRRLGERVGLTRDAAGPLAGALGAFARGLRLGLVGERPGSSRA